jgi:divalent metal cation (Fe/Co/Zn/Cd) transporter
MSLDAAHIVSGKVKGAIRATTPQVLGVLVHMEPHHVAAIDATAGLTA